MKLSEKTVNLLKNFASINQSIAFKKGTTLRTMSVMKNILAEAEIEEEIPRDFAIYDLVQFLNGVTLHDNPSIEFTNESNLTIREGKDRKTKYFFADPSVIVSPPEKSISLPTEDVCFNLDSTQLAVSSQGIRCLSTSRPGAVGEAGVVKLVVRDKKNDTSNEYSINVGETDQEFVSTSKLRISRFFPGTYEVVISQKLLARFVNNNFNLDLLHCT